MAPHVSSPCSSDTESLQSSLEETARRAKAASRLLAAAPPAARSGALHALAELLSERREILLKANARDMEAAGRSGMDKARLNRLLLTPALIDETAAACRHVAELPDPVGVIEAQEQRPNGIMVGRMRIPLGVVAIIYESRPNVTVDAAALCLKAGNAVILRGGSEALHSNLALAALVSEALEKADLPADAAQIIGTTDRAAVPLLCKLDSHIDVMIPRGGESLVRAVCEAATMPVLKHYKGVCHLYVDRGADLAQALDILYNGKVQRPGVCNALECLLVHRDEAEAFLPEAAKRLGAAGVRFRACPIALPLLGSAATPLAPEDLGREFLDLILAVRVTADLDAALEHIAAYGSGHTEVICTNNHAHAMRFLREADASMVAVNASSRFNDGGQLGLGAEIGISTSKLHAYGPMGVRELTTTKFTVLGNGQVRA